MTNKYTWQFIDTKDGFITVKQTKPKKGEIVIHVSNIKSFTKQLLMVFQKQSI